MIGVVRFPGKPPTQCLSGTMALFQFKRFPLKIMAFVRPIISFTVKLFAEDAVIKAATSILEYLPFTISRIISWKASSGNSLPYILLRTKLRELTGSR